MRQQLFSKIPEEIVLYYFEKISRIPRGSGNEKEISDYLFKWASGHGLDAFQDEQNSLIIKKAASRGCENAEPVILQAHMDMVCEKNADSTHDFSKDPITLKVEDDMLMAADGTTLGADNGIGMAYCMAVLASDDFVHPPIEVVLTTEEETSFAGAAGIDINRLKGRRLINLDHAVENEVVVGSCGGMGIRVILPVKKETGKTEEHKLYKISVGGMKGGHSGEDINKGRGSAIQLLNRILRICMQQMGAKLTDIQGGTNRVAISREAEAVILIPKEMEKHFLDHIVASQQRFAKEYQAAAPELIVCASCIKNEKDDGIGYCTNDSFEKIVSAITLFPDGIRQMNAAAQGVVESSINLGRIEIKEGHFVATAEIRGAYSSTVEAIKERVLCLTALLGGEYECFDGYAPWECKMESSLHKIVTQEYKNLFETEMKTIILHAGLECGFFAGKRPELEAVSIGPNCWYFHSPLERVSISSVKKVWIFLKGVLEELVRK